MSVKRFSQDVFTWRVGLNWIGSISRLNECMGRRQHISQDLALLLSWLLWKSCGNLVEAGLTLDCTALREVDLFILQIPPPNTVYWRRCSQYMYLNISFKYHSNQIFIALFLHLYDEWIFTHFFTSFGWLGSLLAKIKGWWHFVMRTLSWVIWRG